MKKYTILSFFIVKIFLVSAQPVNTHGQLRVEGANIINQKGQKVLLKGVSLGWHNWWPEYYNAYVVENLTRKWKISVIRAVMGVDPAGGYIESPNKSEKLIKTVIDAAIENGIYVIVDWHSHDIYTEQAELFFSVIAQQYAGHYNMIYEIFNEPKEGINWEEIKNYSIRIIEAIRKYDKNNLIIVGTPNWSHDVNDVSKDPIEGYDNLVYSLHFYAASHDYVRYKAEIAIRKRLPMFVSECSPSEADGDGEHNKKKFSEWLDFLIRNNISFVLWGLYDKEESSAMLKPLTDNDDKLSISQLSKMGIYSKKIIRGGNNIYKIVFMFIAGLAAIFILLKFKKKTL